MEYETGTDSLRIATELNIKHDSVKKAMLRLEADGLASLKKIVRLHQSVPVSLVGEWKSVNLLTVM